MSLNDLEDDEASKGPTLFLLPLMSQGSCELTSAGTDEPTVLASTQKGVCVSICAYVSVSKCV